MHSHNRPAWPRCAIIAMGVSGSGKSTLVTALAAALDCPAIEGDDYHAAESIAKMSAGQPLDDADRWPWLDRLGATIGAAVAQDEIAVAACSALKRRYRERLEAAAGVPLRFVLLDGSRDTIADRLAARTAHYMPATLLDSQFATLERPGADEHALVLSSSRSAEEWCGDVLDWLSAVPAAAGRLG